MSQSPQVLLFSRDPGGANTIVPVISALQKENMEVLLWGKDMALEKYSQAGFVGNDIEKVSNTLTIESIKGFLQAIHPDFILTGTSAEDKTENLIWLAAKDLSIPTAAILDQWVNYDIRFSPYKVSERATFNKDKNLNWCPDTIFVMDDEAYQAMLSVGFTQNQVKVSGQPYFNWIQKQWKDNAPSLKNKATLLKQSLSIPESNHVITFVSEPLTELYLTSKGAVDFGYNEKTVFTHFISSLEKHVGRNPTTHYTVVIKLHPRENVNNYKDIIDAFHHPHIQLHVDQKTAPWDLISYSDVLIGMSSMLLIEAYLVGKPVLSIQIDRIGADPFILSRRKLVPIAQSSDELQAKLELCLQQADLIDLPTVFGASANQNIISTLKNQLNVTPPSTTSR